MARYFYGLTAGYDLEGAPIVQGPLHLPFARYHGFAIAPLSDHDLVIVEAGDAMLVPVGSVIPIDPWEGSPKIIPVRTYDLAVDANTPARVHVVGLTDPCELSIPAPRRARAYWEFHRTLAGSFNYKVPLGGRRHAMVRVLLVVAGTIEISGRYRDPLAYSDANLRFVNEAASTGDTWHIGGTDHEEGYDTLEVLTGGASGMRQINVMAFGELGG